jgi:hypothetical protein
MKPDAIGSMSLHDLKWKDLRAILDAYETPYLKSALKDDLVALVSEQQQLNPHKILATNPETGEWRVVNRPNSYMPSEGSDEDDFTPEPTPVEDVVPEPKADERQFHKISVRGKGISPDGAKYEILLDDKPVMCRSLSFHAECGMASTVTLELLVDDIEIKGEIAEEDLARAKNPYDNYMLHAYHALKAAALSCDRPEDIRKAENHIIIREMKAYLQNVGLIEKATMTRAQVEDRIRRQSK